MIGLDVGLPSLAQSGAWVPP